MYCLSLLLSEETVGRGDLSFRYRILNQFYVMLYIILCPEEKSQQQHAVCVRKFVQGCGRGINL